MDELVNHCLREIAFDGDLGCDISRLDHFINDFYQSKGSDSQQLIDREFRSFVFTLLAQEPSVTVGLVPEGSDPVYIAPQPSAQRKSGKVKAKSTPASLDPIDASQLDWHNLAQYAGSLRIAVDHETSFFALTGTHIRAPKLREMAYSVLQLVSRARTEGINTVQLSEATGYDAKTIHYLIDQLQSLSYVHKIRVTGKAKHTCVHKYFYPKSSFYVPDPVPEIEQGGVDEMDEEFGLNDDDDAKDGYHSLFADKPLKASDLTIDSLLRRRLKELLKSCPDKMHRGRNLSTALGFPPLPRKQLRHFHSQLRLFAQEGWIEKVSVAHKTASNTRVVCIRLVDEPNASVAAEETATLPLEPPPQEPGRSTRPSVNIPMQNQIYELVFASGTTGIGILELSERLGSLDKRVVEQLIGEMVNQALPPNLVDLTVVQMVETQKREHSLKYYTLSNFRALMAEIGIEPKKSLPIADPNFVGGWTQYPPSQFYKEHAELETFTEKIAQKEIVTTLSNAAKAKGKNPIGPDGNRKKGRPRNEWQGKPPNKRTRRESTKPAPSSEAPPKRGRKRKAGEAELEQSTATPNLGSGATTPNVPPPDAADSSVQPRRRGRPPKAAPVAKKHKPNPSASVVGDAAQGKDIIAAAPPNEPLPPSPIQPLPMPVPTLEPTLSIRPDLAILASVSSLRRGASPDPTLEPPSKRQRIESIVDEPRGTETMGATSELTPEPIKPPKAEPRGLNVNVTYMRREKEFLHVLSTQGGIAISDMDLIRAHKSLLEEWSKQGAAISAPAGTIMDKRTLETLIRTMEDRGAVKIRKTTLPDQIAHRRQVTILYLPTISEEALKAFVESSNKRTPGRPNERTSLRKTVGDYSETNIPGTSSAGQHAWPDLANLSPEKVREYMLTDPHISAQLFGFIAGRVARAREMHLFTLSQLSDPIATSPYFVSKDDFIVDIRYFWNDIPISTYCSIVSANHYLPALEDVLSNGETRNHRVKELSDSLKDHLALGRSRCRYKFFDCLSILKELGIARPMARATGSDFDVVVQAQDSSEVHFKAHDSLRGIEALLDTTYWQFNFIAPVYHFSISAETSPFVSEVPVASVTEGVEYWATLRSASLGSDFGFPHSISDHGPFTGDPEVRRIIRRKAAWSMEYRLSPRQMEYLSDFVAPGTGDIPEVEDANNPDDPFNVLCYAIVAPPAVVSAYLRVAGGVVKLNLSRKARIGGQRSKDSDREIQMTARQRLTQKVQEAKARMEEEWKKTVEVASQGKATEEQLASPALARLRRSYFTSGGTFDLQKLSGLISDALKGAAVVARGKGKMPVTKLGTKRLLPIREFVPTEERDESNPSMSAVMELIKRQTPRSKETNKEKMQRRQENKGVPAKRFQRFTWTPEYDDLLQDATAVVAARCREAGVMFWAAVLQVFPALDTSSARSRINRLRENPATESYLKALENAWYLLWKRDRGSEDLPDPLPKSVSEFDLAAHVVYLRQHLDKRRLRSGTTTEDRDVREVELPESLEDLHSICSVREEPQESRWETLWVTLGDEIRERAVAREPLSYAEHVTEDAEGHDGEVAVARSAIMMLLETPVEAYNAATGDALLRGCGMDPINSAFRSLEGTNVITKVTYDPNKRNPGREWRLQEWQEETLCQPFNPRLYTDASEFERSLREQDSTELSYVVSDGAMAALIELVSDGKVVLSVDTSYPAKVREEVEYNSKKILDDQLETSIYIKHIGSPVDTESVVMDIDPRKRTNSITEAHVATSVVEGRIPTCALTTQDVDELIDCETCVDTAASVTISSMPPDNQRVAQELLQRSLAAGHEGLQRLLLDMHFPQSAHIIEQLVTGDTPPLFWTGYDQMAPRLVNSKYLSAWAVATPAEAIRTRLTFPRRWKDIYGHTLPDLHLTALRCVLGWTWCRPAINLFDLRKRLDKLFDRQEVLELVQALVQAGSVHLEWDVPDQLSLKSLSASQLARVMVVPSWSRSGPWFRMKL